VKIKILALCSIALLSGCATTPVPAWKATPVPTSRLLRFQNKTPENTATLVVTRDEGFIGSACYYGFWINNVLAARLNPGETSKFYIAPGEYVLRAGRDTQGQGLCGIDADNWTQRETVVKANEQKFFRLSIDANGKLDIMRAE